MIIALAKGTDANSFLQLIVVLIIFAFVLFITYFTTKYVGNYQKMQGMNRNFELIEAIRITNNKFLQIVRVANKYLVIAVGKDEITMLTELDKDDLVFPGSDGNAVSRDVFLNYLNSAKEKFRKKGGDSNE